MNGFAVLLRKDILERWRTFRLPAIGLIFLIFGLMSPLLAKYTPELIERFAGDVEISFPTPTTKDAVDQIIKNLAQTGPIAAILLGMGVIASEKQRGTAALILTKPVTRSAFILSKFLALIVTLSTGDCWDVRPVTSTRRSCSNHPQREVTHSLSCSYCCR